MGVVTSGIGESIEFGRGGGVMNTRPFTRAGLEAVVPSSMDRRSMLLCIQNIIDVIWLCIAVMASIWFCIAQREAAIST